MVQVLREKLGTFEVHFLHWKIPTYGVLALQGFLIVFIQLIQMFFMKNFVLLFFPHRQKVAWPRHWTKVGRTGALLHELAPTLVVKVRNHFR